MLAGALARRTASACQVLRPEKMAKAKARTKIKS